MSGKTDFCLNEWNLASAIRMKVDRPSHTQNFTGFYENLQNHNLPQHMFITPNMTISTVYE